MVSSVASPLCSATTPCRDRAHAYLRGLLLDNDDNKTAEAIALKVYGDPAQVRMMQVFVSQSPWQDAPLRHELLRQVDAELGRDDGVLDLRREQLPQVRPQERRCCPPSTA